MRIRRHTLLCSSLLARRSALGGSDHRTPPRRGPRAAWLALAAALGTLAIGCVGNAGMDDADAAAARKFPLTSLPTARVTIDGHSFEVWLAQTPEQHNEGLMYVTEEQLGDRGMLFVFPDERVRGFWMKNTITSLDIAFARLDGSIVMTHTMPPLTLRTFSSVEPAMFALEVKAGAFAQLGIAPGDRLEIPPDLFKTRD